MITYLVVAVGGAAMAYYFGPRLYMADLPGDIGQVIVDKPVTRMAPSIESIPHKVNEKISLMTRRMHSININLPHKPWRSKEKQQQNIDYKRRKYTTPNKSIRPKLE